MSQDDDFALFQSSLQGVRPLQHDRADTGRQRRDYRQLQQRRLHATEAPDAPVIDGLSDQFVLDVSPDAPLHWAQEGVQDSQLRRLKAGQIYFEGTLDLHGLTLEQARNNLRDFIAEACRRNIRCVRVTHGKALRLDGRKPLMKSHVNTWLRQHPQVLGFTSCQPRHGGTGALYVILRRSSLEGRDDN